METRVAKLGHVRKGAEMQMAGAAPDRRVPSTFPQEKLLGRVKSALSASAPKLTEREAQICAGIVLGYTVLGLSLNLNISVNTVATHRKRAYAKLRVCSQNELFARYFGLVEELKSDCAVLQSRT
jgi:DNA-binding CsgD family transcriptional regulator